MCRSEIFKSSLRSAINVFLEKNATLCEKNNVAASVMMLRRRNRSVLFSERPHGEFTELFGNSVIEFFFI